MLYICQCSKANSIVNNEIDNHLSRDVQRTRYSSNFESSQKIIFSRVLFNIVAGSKMRPYHFIFNDLYTADSYVELRGEQLFMVSVLQDSLSVNLENIGIDNFLK